MDGFLLERQWISLPAVHDGAGTGHALAERVTLDDLFCFVAVDDSVQAVKSPTTHQIADALLLNPESLDLIVDVEEERVVPW